MASARLRRSTDVVPSSTTSAPQRFTPAILIAGAVVGITIDGRRAEPRGRQRDRLAVIARRERDDAALQRVGRQAHQHVRGAANLERAARLLRLALEPQRPAGQIRHVEHRRPPRDRLNALRGVANGRA